MLAFSVPVGETAFMPKEDQAQADLDQQVPGDPAVADLSHDPDETGATELDAYAAEVAGLMNAGPGAESPADEQDEPDAAGGETDDATEEQDAEESAEESPDAEPQPDEEQAEGDGEEEDGDDEEPEAATPIKTKRFRLPVRDEVEVEALALKKRHPDWSLSRCEEKARAILGKPAETDGEAPATEEKSPSGPVETVESCRARLTELREQKAQAYEDVDFAAVAKLDLEIEGLRDRVEDLRVAEARAEQAAQEQFFAEVESSKKLAVQVYPDTTNSESALVAKMVEIDRTLHELDDPLYFSPNKPFKLAQMAAAELGVPPNAKRKSVPAKNPKAANAAGRPMQPASGNARTTTPTSTSRFDRVMAEISSLGDYEELVASL